MTCTCEQTTADSRPSIQPILTAPYEKIDAPIHSVNVVNESFSYLSFVDGLTGFYGRLTKNPVQQELEMDVNTGGMEAIYKLAPAASDSFGKGLKQNDTVVGAFTPSRVGLICDPCSTDYGKYVVFGTASVVERWFVPGMQSNINGCHNIERYQVNDATKIPDGVRQALGYPDELDKDSLGVVNALLNDCLRHTLDVLKQSRDPGELFAVLKTLLDTGFLAHHFHLCSQGYRLTSTDVVPGLPGKNSGVIHAVFRYFSNDDLHYKTLLSTSSYKTRSDFVLPNCDLGRLVEIQAVDSNSWDTNHCSLCRQSCARIAHLHSINCFKHGLNAVQCLARSFEEAVKCYSNCACN